MDTNMIDVAYDIDLDIEPIAEAETLALQSSSLTSADKNIGDESNDLPAAYTESLDTNIPQANTLNVQGVDDFGPHDPQDYANEHCSIVSVKSVRWVNDSSVNLEYHNADDAALALGFLSRHQTNDNALQPQTPREAKVYSKFPDAKLVVRQSHSGDRKERGAAGRSDYYRKKLPRRDYEQRDRERGRRLVSYIDYDGVVGAEEKSWHMDSMDESMYDDAPKRQDATTSRYQQPNTRDRFANKERRQVDRYRPADDQQPESRYGRLRNRSASPAPSEDGRLGFSEDGTTLRYRSRSRGAQRRRSGDERGFREPSHTTYAHRKDRSLSFASDNFADRMSNHRRTDATDETANMQTKGSIWDRMTKNGQPVVRPLASRITRDTEESEFGRLKFDESEPQESIADVTPKRASILSRMTKDEKGFSIRGAAPHTTGFSIKGAAGGK